MPLRRRAGEPEPCRVFYVHLSTGSVRDSYEAIAAALGVSGFGTRAAAFRAIRAQVTRLVQEGKQTPALVFDEAHLLGNDVLEELRLLTSYRMDSDRRLCLVLVGLTELRRRLAMAVHASLEQRILVRCHLAGLAHDEVGPYIEHRLQAAGAEVPIFEAGAVEAVKAACNGQPRRIDLLAHYALIAAATDGKRTVCADHVVDAAAGLQL